MTEFITLSVCQIIHTELQKSSKQMLLPSLSLLNMLRYGIEHESGQVFN